jgi:hypothetical protein
MDPRNKMTFATVFFVLSSLGIGLIYLWELRGRPSSLEELLAIPIVIVAPNR